MKPASRWPLHPAPGEGEALSSWLHRIAGCYRMEVQDLLEHDLGHDLAVDLDEAPPLSLLSAISQRSGIGLDRLRCMSFAGWVPWLMDGPDPGLPDALATYAFQFSILLPEHHHRMITITSWRAWQPSLPIYRACPVCLKDPTRQILLLVWKLPLMLSCPLHGCWLESYHSKQGRFCSWDNAYTTPRQASSLITAMDRRTWQALTTGYVELPRRRVHAGIWFRLLRGLLDELSTPLNQCGSYAWSIRYVWERCGYPLRAGQGVWRPYEILSTAVQLQMLEAAATTIELLESNVLRSQGEQAELFMPEPQTGFSTGFSVAQRKVEPVDYWKEAIETINEAVVDARHNPETARSLFALASYGQRDPESRDRLRTMFAENGIPLEFLSHYIPDGPFTCIRLNDGLGD